MYPVRNNDAVSEVVGSILLVSLVVIGVAIAAAVLWSQPKAEKIPEFSASISNSSCSVNLFHTGGETVMNTTLRLLVDGTDLTDSFIKQGTAGPWATWGIGETLEYTPSYPCIITPKRVDIVYSSGSTSSSISTGFFENPVSAGVAPRSYGAPMTPDFTGTPTAGFVPFNVQFSGTSTGSPISWSWDFGDGGTSSDQNPLHTYSGAQSYTVSLTVNNGSGVSMVTKTNYITGSRPLIAEFSAVPTSGSRPLAVQFTDQSLGSPVSWSWTFGDGGTSTVQSPPFTYLMHGRYSVSLTVTNATSGTNFTTKTNYITVNPSPPWYCGWNFRKNITIDKSKVPSDQTNFPVLISLASDSDLAGDARSDGYDILFTSSDGATKLSHEIENFTKSNGALVAWVKVPTVSSAANTTIFMYYGCATASDQQNKNGVWDTGFKGVWHLNQGTGVTAVDSTSNGNDGTPATNPTAATGEIGGALTFGASNQWLNLGTHASLDMTTYSNWTMSAWVKPTSYAGIKWPTIYVYGGTGTTNAYRASMGLIVSDPGTVGQIENFINYAVIKQSTTAVTLNAWNYVTISRDATTTYFYVNGVPAGSAPSTTVTTGGQPSYIGGSPDGPTNDAFKGLIDEVRLSASNTPSGARSADWIRTEYNNQNSPSTFHYIMGEEQWTC